MKDFETVHLVFFLAIPFPVSNMSKLSKAPVRQKAIFFNLPNLVDNVKIAKTKDPFVYWADSMPANSSHYKCDFELNSKDHCDVFLLQKLPFHDMTSIDFYQYYIPAALFMQLMSVDKEYHSMISNSGAAVVELITFNYNPNAASHPKYCTFETYIKDQSSINRHHHLYQTISYYKDIKRKKLWAVTHSHSVIYNPKLLNQIKNKRKNEKQRLKKLDKPQASKDNYGYNNNNNATSFTLALPHHVGKIDPRTVFIQNSIDMIDIDIDINNEKEKGNMIERVRMASVLARCEKQVFLDDNYHPYMIGSADHVNSRITTDCALQFGYLIWNNWDLLKNSNNNNISYPSVEVGNGNDINSNNNNNNNIDVASIMKSLKYCHLVCDEIKLSFHKMIELGIFKIKATEVKLNYCSKLKKFVLNVKMMFEQNNVDKTECQLRMFPHFIQSKI